LELKESRKTCAAGLRPGTGILVRESAPRNRSLLARRDRPGRESEVSVRDHGQSKTEDSLRSAACRGNDRSGSVALAFRGGRRADRCGLAERRNAKADFGVDCALPLSPSRRPAASSHPTAGAASLRSRPDSRLISSGISNGARFQRCRMLRLQIICKYFRKPVHLNGCDVVSGKIFAGAENIPGLSLTFPLIVPRL